MPDEFARLTRVIEELKASIIDLRAELVRKDVYEVQHRGIERRVTDIEKKAERREAEQRAFQRQVMAGAAVGLILLLINIAVGVSQVGGA